MDTILAFPGNMAHAQNAALALHEAGSLTAFVTTFAYRGGTFDSLLRRAPGALPTRLSNELRRRAVELVPEEYVRCHPGWEIVRSLAHKVGANPAVMDRIWDRASHRFDEIVATSYVPKAEAVQAFEYTGLASFERATELGRARILHLPSLSSRRFEEIKAREKEGWPELASKYDAYFDARFQRRQERREKEIALADVIICNSSLTARSHIEAGADAAKIFVVPLGAPTPIPEVREEPDRQTRALRILYAGPFSLRKGAHYLLAAWRRLRPGDRASLDVYGQLTLPPRATASGIEGITFHGSVPRSELFRAYETADVLVLPTLSDGFAVVVAEALAHGCPVITTDQAGAADLIAPDSGLIVPAADSEALAEALRWCLDNRVRLVEMRTGALAAARRWQWSDFRRHLIASLDKGLKRTGYAPHFDIGQDRVGSATFGIGEAAIAS